MRSAPKPSTKRRPRASERPKQHKPNARRPVATTTRTRPPAAQANPPAVDPVAALNSDLEAFTAHGRDLDRRMKALSPEQREELAKLSPPIPEPTPSAARRLAESCERWRAFEQRDKEIDLVGLAVEIQDTPSRDGDVFAAVIRTALGRIERIGRGLLATDELWTARPALDSEDMANHAHRLELEGRALLEAGADLLGSAGQLREVREVQAKVEAARESARRRWLSEERSEALASA